MPLEWHPKGELTPEAIAAGRRLQRLFLLEDFSGNDQRHAEALSIFTEFPELSKEEYLQENLEYDEDDDMDEEYENIQPLTIFVKAGANLDVIRKFDDLPHEHEYDAGCLDAACEQGAEIEILLYFLEKERFSRKGMIFFFIKDDRYSVEDKKALMEAIPGCHSWHHSSYSEYFPLSHALNDPELLKYLVPKFPSDARALHIGEPIRGVEESGRHKQLHWAYFGIAPIDVVGIRMVRPILTQITELTVHIGNDWTSDAIACFWKALPGLSNLQELSLGFDFGRHVASATMSNQLLSLSEQSLAASASIQNICFTSVPCDRRFQAIAAGMRCMSQLNGLLLDYTGFEDAQTLVEVCSNGSTPKALLIENITLDLDTAIEPTCWQQARLESFNLGLNATTHETFSPFLNNFFCELTKAPRLREVLIVKRNIQGEGRDVTEGLLALLESVTLVRFRACGFCADTGMVSEALKANQSVREISFETEEPQPSLMVQVLQNYNTSLECVGLGRTESGIWYCPKIKYWTNLNKAGRKKARDPSTNRAEIVDLLIAVEVLDEMDRKAELEEFNCHYGLLREMPALWSSMHNMQAPLVKKRKHGDN